jgi:hypothetical protein
MADAQKLRDTAERCTRLAHSIADERMRSALLTLATESSTTARLVDRLRWTQSRQPASPEPTDAASNLPAIEGNSNGDASLLDSIVTSGPTDGAQQPPSPEPTQPTSSPSDQLEAAGISDGGSAQLDAVEVSEPNDGVREPTSFAPPQPTSNRLDQPAVAGSSAPQPDANAASETS